jgi:hypothetical protein
MAEEGQRDRLRVPPIIEACSRSVRPAPAGCRQRRPPRCAGCSCSSGWFDSCCLSSASRSLPCLRASPRCRSLLRVPRQACACPGLRCWPSTGRMGAASTIRWCMPPARYACWAAPGMPAPRARRHQRLRLRQSQWQASTPAPGTALPPTCGRAVAHRPAPRWPERRPRAASARRARPANPPHAGQRPGVPAGAACAPAPTGPAGSAETEGTMQ